MVSLDYSRVNVTVADDDGWYYYSYADGSEPASKKNGRGAPGIRGPVMIIVAFVAAALAAFCLGACCVGVFVTKKRASRHIDAECSEVEMAAAVVVKAVPADRDFVNEEKDQGDEQQLSSALEAGPVA